MALGVGLIALAAIGTFGVPPESADAGRYALVDYRIDLDERSKVGTRRAGLTCFPAGSYYWRDIRPDARDTEKAMKAAMRDADPVRFALPDRLLEQATGRPDYRVRATLTAVDMAACSKKWVFGCMLHFHNLPLSGKIAIAVTWEVAVAGSGTIASTRVVESDVTFTQARDMGRDVVTAALLDNARHFVALVGPAAPPS